MDESTTARGRTVGYVIRVLAGAMIVLIGVPVFVIATARPVRTFDLDRIASRLRAIDTLRALRIQPPDIRSAEPDTSGSPSNGLHEPRHTRKAMPVGMAGEPRTEQRDSLRSVLVRLNAVQQSFPSRRESSNGGSAPSGVGGSRPWNALAPEAGMFAGLRSTQYRGPNPSMVIARARDGFTTAEFSYLGAMSAASLWTDFESLGGLQPELGLLQPWDSDTDSGRVPVPPLLSVVNARQLAVASLYRAAFHLAMGDSIRAEHILRVTLSGGFALIDAGAGAIDALAGAAIVDLAHDGLQQLRTHDAPAASINKTAVARPRTALIESMMGQTVTAPTRQIRRELTDAMSDPALPRVLRLQALQSLALTLCNSVRSTLLGPDADMLAAMRSAEDMLRRAPGDSSFFMAIENSLREGPAIVQADGLPARAAASIGDAMGALTGLERISRCARRTLQTHPSG